jgi:NADPH:quinone reductase-like Zn-dependent oxidoreductase
MSPRTIRAYAITSEAVARERVRVGGDPEKMDISKVIELDKLELPDLGTNDVHFRILAVSAEHNIAHAATADTVNIAEARGGSIFPGNSAMGEVIEVGPAVTDFKAGDIVITHCNGEPDEFGFPKRIWAYDQPESVGWYAE